MAIRYNDNKIDWAILPDDALEHVVKVMMFGTAKYGRNTWRLPPYHSSENLENSLKRHIVARKRNELFDDESGLLHTAHAASNVIMWLWHDLNNSWGNGGPDGEWQLHKWANNNRWLDQLQAITAQHVSSADESPVSEHPTDIL